MLLYLKPERRQKEVLIDVISCNEEMEANYKTAYFCLGLFVEMLSGKDNVLGQLFCWCNRHISSQVNGAVWVYASGSFGFILHTVFIYCM